MANNSITLREVLKSTGLYLNEEQLEELLTSGQVLVNGVSEQNPDKGIDDGDEIQIYDQTIVVDT